MSTARLDVQKVLSNRAKSIDASGIRKVGLQWQATARGNSDFDDRYLKLFNG